MQRINVPIIALVAANLVPLIGIFFGGVDLFAILFLYWLESGVIGAYTILKFLAINWKQSFLYVPFFLFHYGGFMAGHLLFIFLLFSGATLDSFDPTQIPYALRFALREVKPLLIGFVASHGISFAMNFIGKREYRGADIGDYLLAPYPRIVLMHVTLIVGGGVILLTGARSVTLALLVLAKIIVDLRAHMRERRRAALPSVAA